MPVIQPIAKRDPRPVIRAVAVSPNPGLWPLLRRRWLAPVSLAILWGAIGAYLATVRPPHYSATTKVTIGTVDYVTESVEGFTEAAQTLASSYALTARSPKVLRPLAREEHSTEAAMAGAISATAVPDSTVFSITATQPTAAAAVRVANAAARLTRTEIASLDTTSSNELAALRRYRFWTMRAASDQQKLAALRRSRGAGNDAKLADVQTDIAEAQVKANAFSTKYQSLVSGGSGQQQGRLLTILAPAMSAQSDRREYLERYIALGLAGGLAAGVLLALVIPAPRRRPFPTLA